MISFFNIRGYSGYDPLDYISTGKRLTLGFIISLVLALVFNYLQSGPVGIIHFKEDWMVITASIAMAVVMGPLIVTMRKASSLLFYAVVVAAGFSMDMYFQAHIRDMGGIAWWMYNPGNFISNISIYPLRFFTAWSFDGVILGALTLYVIRLMSQLIWRIKPSGATLEQKESLFPKEWTNEEVAKPTRDIEYWVLRLLAFGYFAYCMYLVLGFLGISPWPDAIRGLLEMAFANPELLINTFAKIMIMVLCGWVGAYNKRVRWYTTCVMMVAHMVSTIGSLGFYFLTSPNVADPVSVTQHNFLMTSAIVDGVMVAIFVWLMIRNKASRDFYEASLKMPSAYSIPLTLSKIFYYGVAVFMYGFIGFALYQRICGNPEMGVGAVFGSPDPMLCNTFTMCTALGTLAFFLARYEVMRDEITGIELFGFTVSVIVTFPWLMFGNPLILTRGGAWVAVPSYYLVHAVFDGIIAIGMISLRKMSYNIDYVISSLNPSSARNVEALDGSFFGADQQTQTAVLQEVDQYMAGMRGRKRGLLNAPFWVIEHIFPTIYGLHPTFSAMSTDEQKYFLRKYLMRLPSEREVSMIPPLADLSAQLGLACYSLVANAHYSQVNNRFAIGYIPPEARQRLQGNTASKTPPDPIMPAPLPKDPNDPANFMPDVPLDKPLVAPRVVTPVNEPRIPDEVDYMILGSGAGGATAAYRLACTVKDPSKILLVERGNRYSPLQDMNNNEMQMLMKLYKEGGLQLTKKFNMMILQGEAVGGTTVINNAVCFKMPSQVHDIWTNDYGLDLSGLEAEYAQTEKELEIHPLSQDKGINTKMKEVFLRGVDGYNATQSDPNEKLTKDEDLNVNYRNDMGDGLWNIGNKRMRKRSMLETYIPWAEARGVKTVSNTEAVQVMTGTNGKVDRVMLRMNTGDVKIVKVNKAVVLAGGVISSSHILMRSGIMKNVGQQVSCNFAFPVTFTFNENIDAFDGTQITLGALDPQSRAIFETYFNPPASFALALPFQFGRRERTMNNYRKLVNFGALVGSEPRGVINPKPDLINGRAIDWTIGDSDRTKVKYALKTLVALGAAAGAKSTVLMTRPGLEFDLTKPNLDRFNDALDEYPLTIDDVFFATAHPQGGNGMAGANSKYAAQRVTNSDFRVNGFSNLYVADASLFPTGITVNPQWTILAMSSLAAKSIVANHE